VVERGVEAGHGGHVREDRAHRVDAGDPAWLVQRRQLGQLGDPVADTAVEPHRVGELGAAVHDAVPHRVDVRQSVEETLDVLGLVLAGPPVEGGLLDHLVGVVQQRQLEAGRPRVHHQHVSHQNCQVQSRTSGRSSP
jgi:hypothetical protein